MKMYHFILVGILFISLIACEPLVVFNEAQPSRTKNLSKIPNRLQGKYSDASFPSTLLIIDAYQIVRAVDYLDTTYGAAIYDTLETFETKTTNPIFEISRVQYNDTLFNLHNHQVLRKMKGQYFLNTERDDGTWYVKKLTLSKGILSLKSISTSQEIETLQIITENTKDTLAPYRFAPSQKQFKTFLKHDGFSNGDVYLRLN